MSQIPSGLAPRKQPRQQRAVATVAAILDASADLLSSQGYARTSTNQIAARAGVSVGSLYQYFPNKDALMTALLERHHADIEKLVAATLVDLRDASVPIRRSVRRMLAGLRALHEADPKLARAIELAQIESPALHAVFSRREEKFRGYLETVLRERPDVRRGDHGLMAALLSEIIESVSRSLMHGPGRTFDHEGALDEATEAICRYVEA